MPAFDAVSTAQGDAIVPLTTFNITHANSGSTNLVAVAAMVIDDGVTDYNASCTYASVSMTRVANLSGTGSQYLAVFVLAGPTTGSQTVTFTHSLNSGSSYLGMASTWTDTDQTTPYDTPVTNTGSKTSVTDNVTSASGDLVVDVVGVNNQTSLTVGASQTARVNLNQGGAGGTMFGVSDEAGAASVTMSWTWDGSSVRTSHVGLNLNAPAGAGRTTKNTRAWPLGVEIGMNWRVEV